MDIFDKALQEGQKYKIYRLNIVPALKEEFFMSSRERDILGMGTHFFLFYACTRIVDKMHTPADCLPLSHLYTTHSNMLRYAQH